jgi:hypothetical protein
LRALWQVLRIFSYVFEVLLSLFMMALGTVGGSQLDLHGLLPWDAPALAPWLIILGLVGIACAVLAVTGWFRYLFPLWGFAVVAMLFRGFVFSPYSFDRGLFSFSQSIWVFMLAALAFIGSLTVLWLRASERRPAFKD